jgi:DNA-binding MurR/RpiR family transcriptional regulator
LIFPVGELGLSFQREPTAPMNDTITPPQTVAELRAAILDGYADFSKRLQVVASYILDNPDDLALESLSTVAARAKVQPSAIVRFAKALGYPGTGPMQRIIRDGFLANRVSLGYEERVRRFNASIGAGEALRSDTILDEFIAADAMSIQVLGDQIGPEDIGNAVGLIDRAETLYIMGYRRAFPVASYFAYSLQQIGKRIVFMDGVAGLSRQQVGTITARDLFLAISYYPYAQETVEAVEMARAAGAKVLSITDTVVGPIAKLSDQVLQVREAKVRNFRSLSASMCLAQVLVVAIAFEQGAKDISGATQ